MPETLPKRRPNAARHVLVFVFFLVAAALPIAGFGAEPLRETFGTFDAASAIDVDHGPWEKLLRAHVVTGQDGLNRVDYKSFKRSGADALERYLDGLQKVDPTKLNRSEQFAFWTNLYNAKTIGIVLENYPVDSIRDIRLTSFIIPGPWDEKVVTVNGTPLSLNDIEHEILRGIWRDPRVHYAVNCASVGCPNLQRAAFTGAGLEEMLEKGARDYINSARGVRVTDEGLVLSKIYDWFAEDFGASVQGTLTHLRRYANPDLAARLGKAARVTEYEYDWSLNDTE